MLLTITTEHRPATDLGYLLHKHPDRFQSFDLSFGKAHVFYPEAGEGRCTACLLLDVDPVGMVRRKGRDQSFLLGHYVNDRPYVASSFLSVAISQVFGTAMGGRCKDRPELVTTPVPLTARNPDHTMFCLGRLAATGSISLTMLDCRRGLVGFRSRRVGGYFRTFRSACFGFSRST
jgi:RNA repair, ligase-Pnkp-associating, region of Hen1